MSKFFLLSYLIFLFSISIYSFLFIDANLAYLSPLYTGFFAKREIVTLLYLVIIGFFYIFYFKFLFYFRSKNDVSKFRKILVLTFIGLFLSYPAVLSYDIFNYILTAKVLFFYLENPYIVMPIEFTSEPFLTFTRAVNKTALYGPFWVVISGVPFLMGFGNFLLMVINFKLLAVLFYFLFALLLYKMTKSVFKVSLFILNPLAIVETFVSAHNDIIMMFLVVLALHFIVRRRYLFSSLFLIFSVFIKYATIFLLPTFLYVFFQKVHKREINIENVYLISFFSMLTIFFLSAFREEVYPWYSIWLLCFLPLLKDKRLIAVSIALSIGMLLRYIPFMLTGSYFGLTPVAKVILMWTPVIIAILGIKLGYLNFILKEKDVK